VRDGEADLTGQVIAAYFYGRLIPRDFVPQQRLRDGHFPSASKKWVF
jgi:hypothetical protein